MMKTVVVVILALAVVGGGLYGYWQHHDRNKLAAQITGLQSSAAQLNSQNANLTKQLNAANQSIQQLSRSNSYVAGAACQNSQLNLSWEQSLSGGLAGDGGVFSYQNTSTTPCSVNGYPGFLALDSTGHVKPDGPIARGVNAFGSKGTSLLVPKSITLSANDKAYFVVSWGSTRGATSPNDCISPQLIESTPPGGNIPLISIMAKDSVTMCNTVGPISALADQATMNSLLQ